MAAEKLTITVEAGPHDRCNCPVSVQLPEPYRGEDAWELVSPDGTVLPMEAFADGSGVFLLPELAAGTTVIFTVRPAPFTDVHHPPRVEVRDVEGAIAVTIDDTLLTRYHYADVPARPYFYPLLTADGHEVTRAFPMCTDVPGESKDHPHHRSVWIAFGEVNGTDNWSEEAGHGFTRHDSLDTFHGSNVCGRFATSGTWLSAAGEPLLTQRLQVTAWATSPEIRLLDFEIDLTAVQESVEFGDTKEGGILAVRVVGTMDVPRGGRIENSYGGIDEGETWGKAAHWCDYSGPVEGGTYGIAVMDHPLSFRYPTHWHVRNYGLMTANPFAYAAYTGGAKTGEHRLSRGETLRFRYRLLLHSGSAEEGRVRESYLDFVAPPRTRCVAST